MTSPAEQAWRDFWSLPAGSQVRPAGCLPSQMDPVSKQQAAAWQAFAPLIPENASVLDLASGDGRVMGWLRAARPDLTFTGVDLAGQLPPAPPGTQLLGGVAMEALPFPDDTFGCVCSQFGLEYAAPDRAVAELARVLKPGGLAAFLTHRGDGPILEHNLKRAAQIRWAIEVKALPQLAREALSQRGVAGSAVPPAIGAAPHEGAQLHGARSAAWEIAEAIRRTMELGRTDDAPAVAGLIGTIEEKARHELARIASLERACVNSAHGGALELAFDLAGFKNTACEPLISPYDQRPFGDFRLYRRVD